MESPVNAEIYDQGAELALLAALVPHLRERSVVDVGTERGALAAALRAAGFGPLWLLEPFPGHAAHLRERFGSEPGVRVLEVAAAVRDGTAELHLAREPSGEGMDAFHSLVPGRSGPELRWQGSLPVRTRSLDSLCAEGEVPRCLGLLKVDAEGSDADVLRGAAGLQSEVVMVEFWRDLPDTTGPCPYTLEELRELVEPLGPRRFLYVRHGLRHISVGRWGVADPEVGEWGNLLFFADPLVDAVEATLPAIDRTLSDRSERFTAEMEQAAVERLALVNRLNAELREARPEGIPGAG